MHLAIPGWPGRSRRIIQSAGGTTFLDEADIHRGDDFLERVLAAEPDCVELLVLLTPAGIRRPWVLFEISCFRHSRKRIVGVAHGLSVDDVRADPYVGVLLDRRSLIDINQLDTYFPEVRTRIAAAAAATTE
jgi:hypothetical protein